MRLAIANIYSYNNAISAYCSTNASRAHYQAILDHLGADIWSENRDLVASLDIRVARDDVMWLRELGLQCVTRHHSVEELVRKFEEKLPVKQDSWFEDYVSHLRRILFYVSFSHCTCPIAHV